MHAKKVQNRNGKFEFHSQVFSANMEQRVSTGNRKFESYHQFQCYYGDIASIPSFSLSLSLSLSPRAQQSIIKAIALTRAVIIVKDTISIVHEVSERERERERWGGGGGGRFSSQTEASVTC